MSDRIEAWRHRNERRATAIAKSVVAAALIAGCSWVPDALNPIEWYKGVADTFGGDDKPPEIASPRRPDGSFPDVNKTPDSAKSASKGLAGDRENAQYAPSVRREPAPTKALVKRTPPPQAPAEPVQVAQAPTAAAAAPTTTAPAAAAQGGKGSYQPSLDHRMQTARDDGPSAPPAAAAGGPPKRADIPDTIPTKRTVLSEHYQRRLAESAAATNKGDAFAGIPAPRNAASYSQPAYAYAVPEQPPVGMTRPANFAADTGEVTLVPPRGVRGAKGAVIPAKAAASFQVASVQFAGQGGLTAADRAALKDVASLQHQTGGIVRVVGLPLPGGVSFIGEDDRVALGRANAVAKALVALGVPARKIQVAADPAASPYDDAGARISIEY